MKPLYQEARCFWTIKQKLLGHITHSILRLSKIFLAVNIYLNKCWVPSAWNFITARKRSCWKVIFLHVFVCSLGGEVVLSHRTIRGHTSIHPLGPYSPRSYPQDHSPSPGTTQVGGTQSTGMLSCLVVSLRMLLVIDYKTTVLLHIYRLLLLNLIMN